MDKNMQATLSAFMGRAFILTEYAITYIDRLH